MLTVLKGETPTKVDRFPLHATAWGAVSCQYISNKTDRESLLKSAYHGVKAIILLPEPKNYNEAHASLEIIEHIKGYLADLTPNELMRIFPVTKEYSGHKWGSKDYFYTMKALGGYDLNSAIGDKLDHLLWDYINDELFQFSHKAFISMNMLYKAETGKGMMEEFLEGKGVSLYTMHTDPGTGQEFLFDDKTGKTMPVKKRIPRYIRAVK